MDPKHLQVSAAIFESTQARATLSAVEIGTHAASIANIQIMRAVCRADCDDLNGKFVP
jgi:hypothetical protein